MSESENAKPAVEPKEPTFLKSVVKTADVRASMGGLGKMCKWSSYGK